MWDRAPPSASRRLDGSLLKIQGPGKCKELQDFFRYKVDSWDLHRFGSWVYKTLRQTFWSWSTGCSYSGQAAHIPIEWQISCFSSGFTELMLIWVVQAGSRLKQI